MIAHISIIFQIKVDSNDKHSNDKLSNDKHSNNKLSNDQISNVKLFCDNISNDKLCLFTINSIECIFVIQNK